MRDMFNEESVCKKCHNENNDKTECALICKRREAYALNKPWYHIAPYGGEAVTITAKRNGNPLTPFGIKLKIDAGECFLCESKGNRRGFCGQHYDRWRKGYIEHPLEGEWLPNRKTRPKKQRIRMIVVEKSLKQEKAEYEAAMDKRLEKAKKTRKHGISDEALRTVEKSLDAAVKRIDARYNPQKLHTVKDVLDETAARIITIDLVKYDKLYNKIMAESERNYIPVSHTIINLLSIGMQVVELSAKKIK